MSTILVTGANRGIGLEFCRQLKSRGDEVIAACRSSSPDLDQLDIEVIEGVDVGDPESVAQLASRLTGRRIDMLINNAGILRRDSIGALAAESVTDVRRIALGPGSGATTTVAWSVPISACHG